MPVLLTFLLLLPTVVFATGMGDDDARHLLSRSGFTPTQREIQEYAGLSRAAAADRLLAGTRTTARTPLPESALEFVPRDRLRQLKNAPEAERKAFQREQIEKSLALRAWWHQEMLETDSPLTERMTLFWHNHFVSSQQKVKSPVLMARQNQLLRRYALGNFGELLHAIARDPAMVIYLDNVSNKKGSPNENFAREVMELFTLGEGQYSEQDIKDTARAFTGWSLDRNTGEYRFYRRLHDAGEKNVLGRRGQFDGDDVLDILLAQPATAEFVTAKLWREFISPQPDAMEVKRLASIFRDTRYNIQALMRALLTSEFFYAAQNRAVLIKSPVELVVGTLRLFEIHPTDLRPAALAARNLGQDVFGPPNVKGWPGGEAWINSATLLGRRQLLARLFRAEEMPVASDDDMAGRGGKRPQRMALRMQQDYLFNGAQWFSQFSAKGSAARQQVTRLVLATAPQETLPASADNLSFLSALVLDPAYQLK
jgi:uncharacterized protein (DUF1800 family)